MYLLISLPLDHISNTHFLSSNIPVRVVHLKYSRVHNVPHTFTKEIGVLEGDVSQAETQSNQIELSFHFYEELKSRQFEGGCGNDLSFILFIFVFKIPLPFKYVFCIYCLFLQLDVWLSLCRMMDLQSIYISFQLKTYSSRILWHHNNFGNQSWSSMQLTQVWCAYLKPPVHIHWSVLTNVLC